MSFLVIFDLKIGFLTPKYPYGQVLRSVEVFFYVKNVKHVILIIFKMFEHFKFQFFRFTPLKFPRLVVKTASPGPVVSVPTPGSCESHDFI